MGDPHECHAQEWEDSPGNISEIPLEDPDLTLYVDGSRKYIQGTPPTGWAAVDGARNTVLSGGLDGGLSAQVAKLIALIEALQLAEGKWANIYTDSRYAFGVVHGYMTTWERWGFVTAGGEAIKHEGWIRLLLDAASKPAEAAVIKVKAYQKVVDDIQRGDEAADKAAQEVAQEAAVSSEVREESNNSTRPSAVFKLL
uniref:ribonuclease H-like n=1 Tax=Pristiophorus japonicus TaxID=55135 RepID=UPI00398EB7EE